MRPHRDTQKSPVNKPSNRSRRFLSIAVVGLVSAVVLSAATVAVAQQGPARPGPIDKQLADMKWKLPSAVQGVLETNPQTLYEVVRSAHLCIGLGEPEVGRLLLKKAMGMKPTGEQLIDMSDRLGVGMMFRFSNDPDIQPEGKMMSDMVLDAINARLSDVDRIKELVNRLEHPDPRVRENVISELREARHNAIGPLVVALADPARKEQHQTIARALVVMEIDAVQPLLGLLEKADPRVMVQAIRILGAIGSSRAYYYMLGPYACENSDPEIRRAAGSVIFKLTGKLPNQRQAVELLRQRSLAFLEREQPIPGIIGDEVVLWHWNEGQGRCVPRTYKDSEARRELAARFARDARAILPNDPEIKKLYLTASLEWETQEIGIDMPWYQKKEEGEAQPVDEDARLKENLKYRPLAAKAKAAGIDQVEDILVYAMDKGHTGAAIAAARLLGESKESKRLLAAAGHEMPALIRACNHPDRRIRFAAAEAVMELEPQGDFPGLVQVVRTLQHLGSSQGAPRAIVGCTVSSHAHRLAAGLIARGYEVDVVRTGKEMLARTAACPDYEIALIDPAIASPEVERLLYALRKDARSADIRVGVVARDGMYRLAEDAVEYDSLALSFARPHDVEAASWQIDRLLALDTENFVPRVQRDRQAGVALAHLAELRGLVPGAVDQRSLYTDMLRVVNHNEHAAEAAFTLLARAEHSDCQTMLFELASRGVVPLETRKAAAGAAMDHVKRFGLMLTKPQVEQQYERYNASESADSGTQMVLGRLLDAIEWPTRPQIKIPKKPAAEKSDEVVPPGGEDADDENADPPIVEAVEDENAPAPPVAEEV